MCLICSPSYSQHVTQCLGLRRNFINICSLNEYIITTLSNDTNILELREREGITQKNNGIGSSEKKTKQTQTHWQITEYFQDVVSYRVVGLVL